MTLGIGLGSALRYAVGAGAALVPVVAVLSLTGQSVGERNGDARDLAQTQSGDAAATTETATTPGLTGSSAPEIELLRVEDDGSAVVAGRTAADGKVAVRLGDETVATLQADGSGNFASVLTLPEAAGDERLEVARVEPTDEAEPVVAPEAADDPVADPLRDRPAAMLGPSSVEPAGDSETKEAPAIPHPVEQAAAIDTSTASVNDVIRPTAELAQDVQESAAGEAPAIVAEGSITEDGDAEAALAAGVIEDDDQARPEPVAVTRDGRPDPSDVEPTAAALGDADASAGPVPVAEPTIDLAEDSAEITVMTTAEFEALQAGQAEVDEAPVTSSSIAGDGDASPVGNSADANRRAFDALTVGPDLAVASPSSNDTAAPRVPAAGGRLSTEAPAAPQPPTTDEAPTQDGHDEPPVPVVMSRLSIDTITYEADGHAVLGGRGRGDARVRVYVDDEPVEAAPVGNDGAWSLALPKLPTRVYNVRVDQLDAEGAVISRAETAFRPEEEETLERLAATATKEELARVTVQPGFTLWRIATESYGDGFQYVRVFEANADKIRDPDLIYPGQIFAVPD